MDTVILAGGKNTRLSGVVPAYHKPLLVINGETLVSRLVKQALEVVSYEGRVFVLVSQYNCAAIMDVVLSQFRMRHNITFILQQEWMDVADAFVETLSLTSAPSVMLMCADNYISSHDWNLFKTTVEEEPSPISVLELTSRLDAKRFARLLPDNSSMISGPVNDFECTDEPYRCWVGPVVIDAQKTLDKLLLSPDRTVIADHLCPYSDDTFHTVNMDVKDIGIPEALPCA